MVNMNFKYLRKCFFHWRSLPGRDNCFDSTPFAGLRLVLPMGNKRFFNGEPSGVAIENRLLIAYCL